MSKTRLTGDRSYTLFDEASGECFHSHKGALTESEHVFIIGGELSDRLAQAKASGDHLAIVEMGLGTGLNYLLSARAALQAGVTLEYHALEIYLLQPETLASLQYDKIPGLRNLCDEYQNLMAAHMQLSPGVHRLSTSSGTLILHLGDARQAELADSYFDLCYFDAFSPSRAPELWHVQQLKRFYNCLKIGGSWVSYCARGAVRRDLVDCGFAVDRLIGPPGKREMLRATRRS